MAFLRWILGFLISIAITVFAVMNREMVDVAWSPLHDRLSVPLCLIILGSMAFGFILGGVIVWMNMGKLRREKRQQKKALKVLEKEVTRLKEDRFSAPPPAPELFPALPKAVQVK